MSDDICGHTKADGEECTFKAKYDDGKCGHHTDTEGVGDTGRPSKLSYDRQEKIASAIEGGKSLTSAARMAGVDRTTVYGWIDRGEVDKKEGKDNEFVEFYDRLTRAKGHGEDFYFNLALELAKENEDHRFIASLMKQRYPDSWAESDDSPGVNDDAVPVINIPENVTDQWQRNK